MNEPAATRLVLLADLRSVPSSPRARRFRVARVRVEGRPTDSLRESASRPPA